MHQSLKEKQRQEREMLILQAAGEVLLERGFHDTSMNEIAQRVGVAKGTLYQHFASREALMLALFKRNLQGLQVSIARIAQKQIDDRTKIGLVIDELCHQISEKHLLLYILRHNQELEQVLQENLLDLTRLVRSDITALLDEGKVNGAFNASLSTDVMLDALIGMMASRILRKLRTGELFSCEDVASQLSCIYFQGITAPASYS